MQQNLGVLNEKNSLWNRRKIFPEIGDIEKKTTFVLILLSVFQLSSGFFLRETISEEMKNV